MTPPRPSPVTCLIPFITYGFVPSIQNERALAFVGIQLILCRYKSCSYNCTSSLVKHMFLFPVRYRLGMMLQGRIQDYPKGGVETRDTKSGGGGGGGCCPL